MVTRALPTAASESSPARRAALPALLLFCLGHFSVDLYSSALSVLQPLLAERFHFSYTQAGILGAMLVFSGSVMQPAYGYLSDRFPSRLYCALAPAVAAVFICGLGTASNFGALLGLVFLGGAGIASFHPQAAANAVAHVRANRGRAMAIFISAGTVGFACGPTYFSAVLGWLGTGALPWASLPGLLASALLLLMMPPIERRHGTRNRFDWGPLRAVWKPLLLLYILVFLRSVVQVTFGQFLPLYLHSWRGYSLAASSLTLSLFLLGGALGGLAGGQLADRFGGRAVILISMIGSFPFLLLFVLSHGAVSAAALFVGGLLLLFTIPVNVVMAQELVPSQAGTVSALMMGFAWGTSGLVFIPLTGWVADKLSMQTAFAALTFFPLVGFLLALKLPKTHRRAVAA